MPGIATLFQALELTTGKLQTDPQLSHFATIIKAHPGYAHLGALGSALGDFLPADPIPGVQPANYVRIWKNVFKELADRPEGKGFRSTLATLRDGLNDLTQIANDEDAFALMSIDDDTLNDAAKDLERLVGELEGVVAAIGLWIARELTPRVDTLHPADPIPPANQWQARDVMSWKKTGTFVRKLIEKGDATADDRLKAYAYGYLIAYACNVCCSPFINSITGGPFRTQWWRQRLVRNFVDAWVYGFYRLHPRPTIDPSDVPSVPYADWPTLCNANLQWKLRLDDAPPIDEVALLDTVGQGKPFPPIVPATFSQRWFEVFQDVYGGAVPDHVTANSLNGAYVMTYLMLWFQTSGAILGVLGCRPEEPAPPGDCGKDPKELDPFQTDDKGKPAAMPDPNIDDDVDQEWVVCGFILALLNPLSILSYAISGGTATIPGLGTSIADAAVDWDQLRCHLWWYREYMFNAIAGFRSLTTMTGFAYPDPKLFADDKLVLDLIKVQKDLQSARSLVKGRIRSPFPSKVWITFDPADPNDTDDDKFFIKLFNTFMKDPDAADPGFETPGTMATAVEGYPSFFLDDAANSLVGDLRTGANSQPFHEGRFGNVIDNAIDLFAHLGQFPNWNLDADRGHGWLTWHFKAGYNPNAVVVDPEP